MPSDSGVQTVGELEVAFSKQLALAWTTWGGHCDFPVSFFNGAIEGSNPFYNLGSYPIRAETDPGNPPPSGIAALTARPSAQADPQRPPLKAPVAYQELWNDSRSGATLSGTCWEPIPPQGYTSLGAYFQREHGNPPPADEPGVMVCVRDDLLTAVGIGRLIWNDQGSHHHGNLSVWAPHADSTHPDPGTFIASTSDYPYEPPRGPAYTLSQPA